MGKIRSKINHTSYKEELKQATIKAFGKIVFNENLDDLELVWIWNNWREDLARAGLHAPSERDVYRHIQQKFQTDVLPAMREARLWKENHTSNEPNQVDEIIEGMLT